MADVYVTRGSRLAAREVAGEMVILSADDSSVYVLNEIGTIVWRAADGQTPLHDMAVAVAREYDVDVAEALTDIRVFVEELAAARILNTSEEPFPHDES